MKKIILIISIIMFPAIVFASPFLVCDPHPNQSDATLFFKVTGLPPGIDGTHINKEAVGQPYGFKLDVVATPNGGGPYTVRAKACISDAVWGERCSADSNPFTFSAPSVPTTATGLKLAP